MHSGHEHISLVFLNIFWDLFEKFSQNKIVMREKILVPCLDVILIAFFLRNIQWKTIFLILN